MKYLIYLISIFGVYSCSSIKDALQSPAISTSFSDVNTDQVLPDSFGNDLTPKLLYLMQRHSDGGFILFPGFYEMTCRSYCMHAGKYAPSSGEGYLYAPLKGKRSSIIQSLIKNSEQHSEITQKEIQLLIWAIIAKTSFKDLPIDLQLTSAKILSPAQILELNDNSIKVLSKELLDKAISNLPSDIQKAIELENRIRDLMTTGINDYDQIEALAMASGIASSQGTSIALGRWTKHPDGYYIRYFPDGYKHTKVQVYVPEIIGESKNHNSGSRFNTFDKFSSLTSVKFDASNAVAVPANSTEQRLAQSNQAANQNDPCPGSTNNRCNCTKHQVTHINQPDQVSCWQAAFMMAFNSAPIVGDPSMLNPNGTLKIDEGTLTRFASDNNLKLQSYQSLSPDAIQELLRSGPIWVGGLLNDPTYGNYLHAYCIGGIEKDCSSGESFIDVYDSLKSGASNESFSNYMTTNPVPTIYVLSK